MRTVDLIHRKRDGEELSPEELQAFLESERVESPADQSILEVTREPAEGAAELSDSGGSSGSVQTDPAFLFESPQHKEALARLEYAVEEKDLALLVGDIGSGKTMLSRALMDRIGDARPIILLINPRLTPTQLLRSIASGLGLAPSRFRVS